MTKVGTASACAVGWILAAAVAAGGCGDASSDPLSPAAPSAASGLSCQNLPQPMPITFDASGGVLSALILAPAECTWIAEAAPWIGVQNVGPHVGPATLKFMVEPNRAFASRLGEVVLRDEQGDLRPVYEVKQRAATCLYELSQSSLIVDRWGTYDGSGDTPIGIMVTARPATCQWTATSSASWIKIVYKSAQGTGDRRIYVSIVPSLKNSTLREGTVTVAGLSGLNPDVRLNIAQM